VAKFTNHKLRCISVYCLIGGGHDSKLHHLFDDFYSTHSHSVRELANDNDFRQHHFANYRATIISRSILTLLTLTFARATDRS
jgi:hypothetical protein